jgi:hypothetical protein
MRWGSLPVVAVVVTLWPHDLGGDAADDPRVYMARHRSLYPGALKQWGNNRAYNWNNGFHWNAVGNGTNAGSRCTGMAMARRG